MTLCTLPVLGALLCSPPQSHSLGSPPPYHWEEPIVWELCGRDSSTGEIVKIEGDYELQRDRLLSEGIHITELACPRDS